MENTTKIKEIIVLAKLENGDIHQVLLTHDEARIILNVIPQITSHKTIVLDEEKLEGVTFYREGEEEFSH